MINFSGISSSGILGKSLRFLLKAIPRGMPICILQGPLKGKTWVVGAGDNNGFWLGSYELETQRVLEQNTRPGDVVYDIGANVGFYTLLASFLVGKQGRVYAFEPFPANVGFIKKHISLNKIINVSVFDMAIADKEDVMFFKTGINSAEGKLSNEGDLKVNVMPLDSMVRDKIIPPPQIMKIDVEGAELKLFEGAREMIKKYRPKIILSTHGDNIHVACINWLRSMGYCLQAIPSTESLEKTGSIFAEAIPS